MNRWSGVLVLALLSVSCAATTSPPAAKPAPTATPIPSPPSIASVLVFQQIQGTSTHFTFTHFDGTVIKAVDTSAGSADGRQSEGAGLLLGGANGAKAVLGPDGTVTMIPATVISDFGQQGIGNLPGDAIVLRDGLILGTVGYDPATYMLVDLASAQSSTLLQAKRIGAVGGVAPPIMFSMGISATGGVARILVRHADYGQPVAQWALVEVDLKQKMVIGAPNLPLAEGVDSYDTTDQSLSVDGTLFAYQEQTTHDAQNKGIVKTHIAVVGSGLDTVAADTTLRTMSLGSGLRFSPDGSALVALGEDAWPTGGKVNTRMLAFATSDGHVLSKVGFGDAANNMIQAVGWTGPHTLAYVLYTTTDPGSFSVPPTGFTVDVATGARSALPTSLGSLVAVLS